MHEEGMHKEKKEEEEREEEEKEKCELMARPETISSTVVIKKADALMSPFLQLKQVSTNSLSGRDTVLFFDMERSTISVSKLE